MKEIQDIQELLYKGNTGISFLVARLREHLEAKQLIGQDGEAKKLLSWYEFLLTEIQSPLHRAEIISNELVRNNQEENHAADK